MDYLFETEEFLFDLISDPSKLKSRVKDKSLSNELSNLEKKAGVKISKTLAKIGFSREDIYHDPDVGNLEMNYLLQNNLLIEEYAGAIQNQINSGLSSLYVQETIVQWYFKTLKIQFNDLFDVSTFYDRFKIMDKDIDIYFGLEEKARKIFIEEVESKIQVCEKMHHIIPEDITLRKSILELDYVFYRNKEEHQIKIIDEHYLKRFQALKYWHLEKPIVGNDAHIDNKLVVRKCQEAFEKNIGYTREGKIVVKQIAEYLIDNTRFSTVRGATKALNKRIFKGWYLLGDPVGTTYNLIFQNGCYYILEKMN